MCYRTESPEHTVKRAVCLHYPNCKLLLSPFGLTLLFPRSLKGKGHKCIFTEVKWLIQTQVLFNRGQLPLAKQRNKILCFRIIENNFRNKQPHGVRSFGGRGVVPWILNEKLGVVIVLFCRMWRWQRSRRVGLTPLSAFWFRCIWTHPPWSNWYLLWTRICLDG